jgi:hypothetical protein
MGEPWSRENNERKITLLINAGRNDGSLRSQARAAPCGNHRQRVDSHGLALALHVHSGLLPLACGTLLTISPAFNPLHSSRPGKSQSEYGKPVKMLIFRDELSHSPRCLAFFRAAGYIVLSADSDLRERLRRYLARSSL